MHRTTAAPQTLAGRGMSENTQASGPHIERIKGILALAEVCTSRFSYSRFYTH